MNRVGEHAVVVGGSMAGLLAARVLSEAYDRVTVVERDSLPAVGEGRRAVPQGHHAHVLLMSGQEALEDLLPGFVPEMVEAGAATLQPLVEMSFTVAGHPLARVPVGPRAILASRPLFEGVVRRRVRALPGVQILQRCDALALVGDAERVSGVRIRHADDEAGEEVLASELVVAATGRSGRVPSWLGSLGHVPPPEERLVVDLAYVSLPLRLRPGALGSDKLAAFTALPGCARGLVLLSQEGGRWLLTVNGYGGDHPPRTWRDSSPSRRRSPRRRSSPPFALPSSSARRRHTGFPRTGAGATSG
jgi:2-polyprenyl-6-methoxyphenol hydroxylase-like FAD-dependent oxidoreductase